jgi:acyl carrier protein
MTNDELLLQLQDIFQDIFDDETLVLTRDSSASTIEDWDSLAHVNLVTAIEKRYKVHFGLGELHGLKNVGDMVDLLQKLLAAK